MTRLDSGNPSTPVAAEENQRWLDADPGVHPLGVLAGAAGGSVGLATVGVVLGGPIGGVVGAVAGAIAGGLAGNGAAEVAHPTTEHAHWRHEFRRRAYYVAGLAYDDFAPAYELGWRRYLHDGAAGKTFEEIEPELRRTWETQHKSSRLSWVQARAAMHDAWMRMKLATIGDPSGPLRDEFTQ